MSGVSIDVFCAVEKALRRAYGSAPVVPIETINCWIKQLAQIESEYRDIVNAAKAAGVEQGCRQ